MNMQVVSKSENKLMDRTEVRFAVTHEGEPTPARDAVRTSLASALSVQKERVVVSDMQSEYGMGSSNGYAKIYGSLESAKKHERNNLLVRNGLAEKKKKRVVAAKVAKPSKR